jgi:hypothetical protein
VDPDGRRPHDVRHRHQRRGSGAAPGRPPGHRPARVCCRTPPTGTAASAWPRTRATTT